MAEIVFNAFDLHQDGLLPQSELKHALRALGISEATKQQVNSILRSVREQSHLVQAQTTMVFGFGGDSSPPRFFTTTDAVEGEPITIEEFVAIAKELGPISGSNDELWRSFSLVEGPKRTTGRITEAQLMAAAEHLGHADCGAALHALYQSNCDYPAKGMTFEEWKLIHQQITHDTSRKKSRKYLT